MFGTRDVTPSGAPSFTVRLINRAGMFERWRWRRMEADGAGARAACDIVLVFRAAVVSMTEAARRCSRRL